MSKNVTETSAGKPFLERQALQKLISWKKAPRRNALCVVGARQIGKTMLIRHFARQHYEHFVEINFATEPLAKAVFSGSLNAEAVITRSPLMLAVRWSQAKRLSSLMRFRNVRKLVPTSNF